MEIKQTKEEGYAELKEVASEKGLADQRTTYRERMHICEECDSFLRLTKQCKECGCFMFLKARIAKMSCPLDKWGSIEPWPTCSSSWLI